MQVSTAAAGNDFITLYEVEPAGADSATYQLRWHEWDGLWRATRDTTIRFTTPPPPVTIAQFDLGTSQPSNGLPSFRYCSPTRARPRSRSST